MTDTPDIEALVARLRDCGRGVEGESILDDAASALERQQAVVAAARRYQNHLNNVNRLALFAALNALAEGEG